MKKILNPILYILISLALTSWSQLQAAGLKPDYLQLQTMGYQGAIGLGVVYEPNYHYELGLIVGYSPEELTGHRIIQLNWQNRFQPATYTLPFMKPGNNWSPHIGFSVLYNGAKDLWVDLPDRYPDSYYGPTALRGTIDLGVKVQIGKDLKVILQWSALDTELGAMINHSEGYRDSDRFGSWLVGWQTAI